jgi:hypothetical protein
MPKLKCNDEFSLRNCKWMMWRVDNVTASSAAEKNPESCDHNCRFFHDYFEDADRIGALPSQGQNRNAGKSLRVESPPLLLFLSKQLRGPIWWHVSCICK